MTNGLEAANVRTRAARGMTSALVGLPVASLLLLQVALFAWMAPRGFEFTDESYYFLSYLYWRDSPSLVPPTLFGAYFELPFRMLDQSVAGIRMFGLALLMVCSAFCTRSTLQYVSTTSGRQVRPIGAFMLAGAAASMLYFSYLSTLRAPSYNLLALSAALLSTGILLHMIIANGKMRSTHMAMIAYGAAIGACALAKPTTAILLVVAHATIVLVGNTAWLRSNWRALLVNALIGVLINFALLQAAHPDWISALYRGANEVLASGTDADSRIGLNAATLADMRRIAKFEWGWSLAAAACYWMVAYRLRGTLSPVFASLTVAIIVSYFAYVVMAPPRVVWLYPIVALTITLTVGALLVRRAQARDDRDARFTGLLLVYLCMPLALSFGTNMSLLRHSEINGVFAILALLVIVFRMHERGELPPWALAISLAAFCLQPLALQVQAATKLKGTYRQLSALGKQTTPINLGSKKSRLLVDENSAHAMREVLSAARAAGWTVGSTVLDLTGDGPGWIFALGGKPLGTAWLLGGYPYSEERASLIINDAPVDALRQAWLLTSETNPRRIVGWQNMLQRTIGDVWHQHVATIQVPVRYQWGASDAVSIDLMLWKPKHIGK